MLFITDIDDIPPPIKLKRQATISGYENVIDPYSGLPIGICKYFSIEKSNFKEDNTIPRPYYNMLCFHRDGIINNIISIVNMINSKSNMVFNIIYSYIIKYMFYKNDLLIVNMNIFKYCE